MRARKTITSSLLAAAVLATVSIGSPSLTTSTKPGALPTPPAAPPVPPPPTPSGGATTNPPTLQVFGPGGTEGTARALVDGARQRVLVEAYALDDRAVLAALARAVGRGVDVRVMLDPRGLNSAASTVELRGAGVRTRAPNPAYVTHLDMIVVDASALAVLTSFLSAGNLGPSGQAYAVVDRDRLDVLQGASLFYDDWLRRPVRLFGHNLVLLPEGAGTIAARIDHAGARVELYTSGLSDPAILSSLHAARGRGVVARVLTQASSNSAALRGVAEAGRVRFLDAGRGTMLVIDRRSVLLGSMDLSANTLKSNRELAVTVGGQAVASFVDTSFFAAFAHGQAPKAPVVIRVKPGKSTVTRGKLSLTVAPPSLVRVGGEGLVVVSTAANASVGVTITYPSGSTPRTMAGAARPSGRGAFVYRWILPGGIKSGQAQVVVTARSGGQTLFVRRFFAVAR